MQRWTGARISGVTLKSPAMRAGLRLVCVDRRYCFAGSGGNRLKNSSSCAPKTGFTM
jgi:hypothetical protein